jgi:YidC/Oxa1 family membrane protein insertase
VSGSLFDPLYKAVAAAVVGIHDWVWKPIFGEHSGWGWALSIATLTVAVRLLLFPLFKKQIRSQRKLQELQPKFRELREKYKNDKPKLNEEMMKIQREHGNPLLGGCGPVVLQIPLFLSLFRVMNGFRPRLQHGVSYRQKDTGIISDCSKATAKSLKACYDYVPVHDLSYNTVHTIATSKIFGVPLASAFNSPAIVLQRLDATSGTVKLVAGILILIMSGTTFVTQRQIMGRQPLPEDPQQRQQQQMTQRIFLYLAPGMLLISGLLFPIGVLIYWLTTNLWSVGQQYYMLRAMPPTLMPGMSMPTPKGPPSKRPAGPNGQPAPGKPKSPRFGGGKAGPEPEVPIIPPAPLKQVRSDTGGQKRSKNSRPGGNSSKKKRR